MGKEVHKIDGVAYVLPLYEGGPRWAKRIGSFGVGIHWRWTSFNFGVDILEAGALIAVGPFYVWIAHISKQEAAFKRLRALATPQPAQAVQGRAVPADVVALVHAARGAIRNRSEDHG